MNIININENYNNYFNSDLKTLFGQISQAAQKSGHKVYLIGGIVRDLLLNRENHDIDITVEGDAIAFVNVLEKECEAKILSIHEDFGTVKAEIMGQDIDFASTRSETYPKKGHLPVVEKIGCPLEEDILRRDFTINSLAISLNQENFGSLIDYVNGFDDLNAKKIRILHNNSFIDDPTRIIRALKYSSRLDFELDETTLRLQEEYLKNINYDMCYKRVKNEIKKTFEQNSQDTFEKFVNQGIYLLATKNNFNSGIVNAKNLIDKYKPEHPWIVYFGIIAIQDKKCDELCDKLELTKAEKATVVKANELLDSELRNNFEIYKAFIAQNTETLLILAASGLEKQVLLYLESLKPIKLSIGGRELIEMGITPSKAFSEGFDYVLKEKLKNPLMNKEEELNLIREFLKNQN